MERPKTFTNCIARAIIQHVAHHKHSASSIKIIFRLDVSIRTIQLVFPHPPHMKYVKRKHSLALKDHHRNRRLEWAKSKLQWKSISWKNITFANEKSLTKMVQMGCSTTGMISEPPLKYFLNGYKYEDY